MYTLLFCACLLSCFLEGGQGSISVVGWQEELSRKVVAVTLWLCLWPRTLMHLHRTIHLFILPQTIMHFKESLGNADKYFKTLCTFILWPNVLKFQNGVSHIKEHEWNKNWSDNLLLLSALKNMWMSYLLMKLIFFSCVLWHSERGSKNIFLGNTNYLFCIHKSSLLSLSLIHFWGKM